MKYLGAILMSVVLVSCASVDSKVSEVQDAQSPAGSLYENAHLRFCTQEDLTDPQQTVFCNLHRINLGFVENRSDYNEAQVYADIRDLGVVIVSAGDLGQDPSTVTVGFEVEITDPNLDDETLCANFKAKFPSALNRASCAYVTISVAPGSAGVHN